MVHIDEAVDHFRQRIPQQFFNKARLGRACRQRGNLWLMQPPAFSVFFNETTGTTHLRCHCLSLNLENVTLKYSTMNLTLTKGLEYECQRSATIAEQPHVKHLDVARASQGNCVRASKPTRALPSLAVHELDELDEQHKLSSTRLKFVAGCTQSRTNTSCV